VESRYARAYEERVDPFRDFIAGERAARRRALSAPDRIMFELGQVVSSSRCVPALRARAQAPAPALAHRAWLPGAPTTASRLLGHFRGQCSLPAHALHTPGCRVRACHCAASEQSRNLELRAMSSAAPGSP